MSSIYSRMKAGTTVTIPLQTGRTEFCVSPSEIAAVAADMRTRLRALAAGDSSDVELDRAAVELALMLAALEEAAEPGD